jgi:hypothetical protein
MATTEVSRARAAAKVSVKTAIGAASAAFLASGVGVLFIGLMTTAAEVSEGLRNGLNWWNPAGPLTGKTAVGVIAWLISWIILHMMWKDKEMDFDKVYLVTLILIGLGFLLTFPPVFGLFAAE